MCRYVSHRYVSKCAGTVKVPRKGKETDLVTESTGLKVLDKGGEGAQTGLGIK
jgi:hypothetical protein